MMLISGCGKNKNLEPGSVWEVPETTTLSKLTIADDASIKATEGKSLTMTVDGVKNKISPGEYKGRIMLTVKKSV